MNPAYRLTVYRPRSSDPTESNPLVPAAGAPHSDNFIVASRQGIAGAKPYLNTPRGLKGQIDPLTKRTTTGTLALDLQDIRTSTGNLQRWVTAFFGDTNGKQRLLGLKAYVEESIDGGSSWSSYFTGRVAGVQIPSGGVGVTLTIRDLADEMQQRTIFSGAPHSSITYAGQTSLTPAGPMKDWGVIKAAAMLAGVITSRASNNAAIITIDRGQDWLGVITDAARRADYDLTTLRVILFDTVALTTTTYALVTINPQLQAEPFTLNGVPHHTRRFLTMIQSLPFPGPGVSAGPSVPPLNRAVKLYITRDAPASAELPLLLNSVHPVQFWADILDGYFARLDPSGSPRALAARANAPGWTTGDPWKPLIDDLSFGTCRFDITQTEKPNDFIEKQICLPFNLTYRFDADGKVVPIDLRRSSAIVSSGTLIDADLVSTEPPSWDARRDGAVTGIELTYYRDVPITDAELQASRDEYPNIPPTVAREIETTALLLNDVSTLGDIGERLVKIDAKGVRVQDGEQDAVSADNLPTKQLRNIRARLTELLIPYQIGPASVTLHCRRTAAVLATQPGQWKLLTISRLPDPATNQRGGSRLVLCTARTERGATIDLEFVDAGSGTVANTPTFGALAAAADDSNGIDIPITLNAQSERVAVQYAVTSTSVAVRPSDTSGQWTASELTVFATGTLRLNRLPRMRIWLRARSEPTGESLKLPSAWVFPAAGAPAGSIDLTAITAPSALAASNIVGNQVDLTWTVGDATMPIEVFITPGGVPGTWTDAMKVPPTLDPASTFQRIADLTPSTAYACGVRHRDAFGGVSAMATTTFSTTGTAATAPTPPPIGVAGGGPVTTTPASPTLPFPKRPLRSGVSVLLFPADPSYNLEVQRAPDSAGAPNVGAAVTIATNVPATQKTYVDAQPLDNAQRWYRMRHVGRGATPSAYTDWQKGTPVMLPVQGPTQSIARPLNSQSRFRCKLRLSAGVTLVSGTPKTILWDVEDSNVGALHSLSANTERITIPTGGDVGMWEFQCCFDLLNNATAGQRTARIRWSNGSLIVAEKILTVTNEWEDDLRVTMPAVAVGEYFWVEMLQASGVNQTFNGGGQIGSFVAIHKW